MTPPHLPPRRHAWVAFALIGFVAGVLTVIVAVRYVWPLLRSSHETRAA